MIRRFFTVLLASLTVSSCVGLAADTLSPQPQGAEVAFVSGIQSDLSSRFATIAQAQAAGYFRYTGEDKTGSISYANRQWTSSDPQHPSQLGTASTESCSAPISRNRTLPAPNPPCGA